MSQELPEELLDRIIYYVVAWHHTCKSWISKRHRETLLSTCLASKTLCRLARLHLYKAFSNHAEKREFYWTGMGLDRPNVINASFPPLMHYISAPYVRTLHARPEYGRMLGSLSISLADHPDSRGPQQWSYQCRTDLIYFQRRARGFWFGMAESARFREGLELALFYNTPDATACMILLACPNIKTLEILGIGVEEEPRLVGSLVAHLLVIGTAQTSEPEHDPDAQVSDVSPSEDRVLTRPILAELLKMETARAPESEPGPGA